MELMTTFFTIVLVLLVPARGIPPQGYNPHSISFPGEQQVKPGFRGKVPPKCRSTQFNLTKEFCEGNTNLEFCVEDEEYDGMVEKRFRDLLDTKFSYMKEVLNNDILGDPEITMDKVTTRFSSSSFTSETSVCLGRETLIFPKRAQNANQDWVFVLNQPNLQQGVRVEVCLREGEQCRFGGIGFTKTVCRQKYIYKKMLTMDNQGSNIVPESVFLPSCCVCYVADDFARDDLARRGGSNGKATC